MEISAVPAPRVHPDKLGLLAKRTPFVTPAPAAARSQNRAHDQVARARVEDSEMASAVPVELCCVEADPLLRWGRVDGSSSDEGRKEEPPKLPVVADDAALNVKPGPEDAAAVDAVSAFRKTTWRKFIKQMLVHHEDETEWVIQALTLVTGAVLGWIGQPASRLLWVVAGGLVGFIVFLVWFSSRVKSWRRKELDRRQDEILELRAKLDASTARLGATEAERDDVSEAANRAVETVRKLFDQQLHEIMRALKLDKTDARITLYLQQMRGLLVLQGRWCIDPELREPGRQVYPISEGCIGEAWHNGRSVRWDTSSDEPGYCAFHANMKFPAEKLAELRMKSKSYLGTRIDESATEPLGVVLLESTKPDVFTDQTAERIFALLDRSSAHGQKLVQLIQAHRSTLLDMNAPRSRGF